MQFDSINYRDLAFRQVPLIVSLNVVFLKFPKKQCLSDHVGSSKFFGGGSGVEGTTERSKGGGGGATVAWQGRWKRQGSNTQGRGATVQQRGDGGTRLLCVGYRVAELCAKNEG